MSKGNSGEKIVSLTTNGAGTTGHAYAKKKKKKKKNLNTDFIPFIKIKSKWITDLKLKRKTIKILAKNRRKSR